MVSAIEVPEGRSLPAALIPALRTLLLKLDRLMVADELSQKALRVLGSFVSAVKVKYADVEFGLDLGKEIGCADTGDLEYDLTDMFRVIGLAAKKKQIAIALFIDEIQYLKEEEFASLIVALHKCNQEQLPITIIGAGLPQLVGQAGRAKSYAERLFEYPEIGQLSADAAKQAIVLPAKRHDVLYQESAVDEILAQTQSYPYFLQEWGKHSWQCADSSPIKRDDVLRASEIAISELDRSFFRVRFDRLTPSEKRYLRAMAELGCGSLRSGDIASLLDKQVQSLVPVRAKLINKGMIYSVSHGENRFTVPLFDAYMKRIMPELVKA